MALKFMLTGFALMLATPATAATEWWWIGLNGAAPNRVVTYLDRGSVRSARGDISQVWTLAIGETPLLNGQQHQMTRYLLNCRSNQLATVDRIGYDPSGTKMPMADIVAGKLAPAVRGSIGESVLQLACGRPSGMEVQVPEPVQHAVNFLTSTGRPAASTAAAPAAKPEVQGSEPGGLSTGTGFFIGPDGHVLTSHHVIAGAGRIVCRTVSGKVLPAVFVNASPANDLALLRVDTRPAQYLGFAAAGSVRLGDRVFTMGFPVVERLGLEPKFTEGTVSALSGRGENALMQISIPIQPGNSGGPVVTEKGQVVGVIAATEAIESFYKDTGALPQNVNWAVKADYARPLLRPMPSSPPRTRDEAIALARNSVCLIGAER